MLKHDELNMTNEDAMSTMAHQFMPRAAALAAAILLGGGPWAAAFAQDATTEEALAVEAAADQQDEEEDAQQQADDTDYAVEEVVVTGSRLKRDTYTSITPLQIIHADVQREAGLVDAAEILQEATTASGVQVDLTFSGLVLSDGPGTVVANLRGLGASRTLVLINGRRVAPSGVEGAPANPDLAIVPGLLVQQYDQLLDGASSVYGSDAVAGVINAILKKDFDGFRVESFVRVPQHGPGRQETLGLSWGKNWDRGFIGFGAEYQNIEAVTLADRPWTAGCEKHYEIDQEGKTRQRDMWYSQRWNMRWDDDCTVGYMNRVVVVPGAGWVFYTPGESNGGWPNFSDWNEARWSIPLDGDGDGYTDISFRDYSMNGQGQFRHLFSPRTTTKAMSYGEYTFEGEMNLTPYFEVIVMDLDYSWQEGIYSIFPWVPARNPFNICNPEGEGVDCGLARDQLWHSPEFAAQTAVKWKDWCASNGHAPENCNPAYFNIRTGPIGPARVQPIIAVRGDRNQLARSSTTWRGVAGLSGDLPFLNVGSLSDWTFDLSFTRSISNGTSVRPGIREDRLRLAIGDYSTTNTPCENDIDEATRVRLQLDPLTSDSAPGCVPVNLFAPSLYDAAVGDFATHAERDYVFDNRDFATRANQNIFTFYVTGTVFEMPAGPVHAGFGYDYRVDRLKSIPDHVARDGLIWGYFSDGGADGEKTTKEAYGEIELPLLAERKGATELTVNLSARYTDDEYYGGAGTGAAKIGWRPIPSFLVRATYGTSYRAPNLRELFLRGQTGFLQVYDPCFAPEEAFTGSGGPTDTVESYNAEADPREPHVLERCLLHGVDPTLAYSNGVTTFSTEVSRGGSQDLDEETSESMTFGFSWAQDFTEMFDLNVGLTYYKVEIDDTIIEPTPSYIVYDCYQSETSAGVFCSRIDRDLSNPANPRMRLVDRAFINRDNETVRGVDLNIAFDRTFSIFDRPVDMSLDVTGHRLIERTTLLVNDAGERDLNSFHRMFGYAEHKAEIRLRADYDRWHLSWIARYVGNYEEDPGAVDNWGSVTAGNASTCLGPPTDSLCRDIETIGDYWLHNMSVGYETDTWSLSGGLRNVFDRPPPKVAPSEFYSLVNNVPRGLGYDLHGRTYFLDVKYSFGREG